MDEVEENLTNYIKEINIAKNAISQLKGIEIESMDLQLALCDVLNVERMQPTELLSKKLTNQQIIDALRNYNFLKNKPEVLCEIELEVSILPEGTPKLLTEQTLKVKGEVWIVHKNDQDPFPSSPHAHNYESGVSLHLGTGEFFRKRDSIGFVDCKKLKSIREKISNHVLPKIGQRCI